MASLQRVGVLVERGAVKIGEPVRIVGEVAGNPVQYYAQALAMTGIDQRRKILR